MLVKAFKRYNPVREAVLIKRRACHYLLSESTPGSSKRATTIIEPTDLRAVVKARHHLRRWWDKPRGEKRK